MSSEKLHHYDVLLVRFEVVAFLSERRAKECILESLDRRPFFKEILLKIEDRNGDFREVLVDDLSENSFCAWLLDENGEEIFGVEDKAGCRKKYIFLDCPKIDEYILCGKDLLKRVRDLGLLLLCGQSELHYGRLELTQISWPNEKIELRRQIRGQETETGEWVGPYIDNEDMEREKHQSVVYTLQMKK